MNSIRAYFYDAATLKTFADKSLDHSHDGASASWQEHDDHHDKGDFHIHLEHTPPAQSFVSV